MIFPEEFERKLGFDQIRERLRHYCLGPLGARLVDEMSFSSDFNQVKSRLEQNAEFKQILEKADEFPASHYYDTDTYFKTAAIEGSFLEEEAFHQILLSLQTILACTKYLASNQRGLATALQAGGTCKLSRLHLVKTIESKFDDRGLIRDNASAELAHIRKRLREEQSRVKRLADQIFRKAVEQGWVPEGAIITIRDGRPAIPIQAEHKRKLQGFILDESATGQTVFMEPAEVLDANNEIRDLLHADRREVVRILRELTYVAAPASAFFGICVSVSGRA
jgi:DNA mismatch repair protein MutS2